MTVPNPFTGGQGLPPVVLVFSKAAANPGVLMGALTGCGEEAVRWIWKRAEQVHAGGLRPMRQAVAIAMEEAKQQPWIEE